MHRRIGVLCLKCWRCLGAVFAGSLNVVILFLRWWAKHSICFGKNLGGGNEVEKEGGEVLFEGVSFWHIPHNKKPSAMLFNVLV
jgi:hypothetical protein